jgi:hypothetical protein
MFERNLNMCFSVRYYLRNLCLFGANDGILVQGFQSDY